MYSVVAQAVRWAFDRWFPFRRGLGPIVDHTPLRLLRSSDVTRRVRTTDGVALTVFPNELIGRHLTLTGQFDQTTLDVLREVVRPGDVVLDVGANIGYVSATLLHEMPDIDVVAVEPLPLVVPMLRANLAPFGARARVVEAALTTTASSVHLVQNDENLGASRIMTADAAAADPRAVRVDAIDAARLVTATELTRIDVVKVDVEGHELEVLATLSPWFERLQTRAVLFECHEGFLPPTHPLRTLLDDAGFSLYGVRKRLRRVEFVDFVDRSAETVAGMRIRDVLAVRGSWWSPPSE